MSEKQTPASCPSIEPITVFIASWGRPIYLWACLDALYRRTQTPARIILLNNAHPDPLVGEVINGFERRGLFTEVVNFSTNTFENIRSAYHERLSGIGSLHVYLESDCLISDTPYCWLDVMREIMEEQQTLGILGSLIEPDDFVEVDKALSLTGGDLVTAEFLAKLKSPERAFIDNNTWAESSQKFAITQPPFPLSNPPGRLMMLRTDLMKEVGFRVDGELAAVLGHRGFASAVTPLVRHRHLSLLNIYDYADYDAVHRGEFFSIPQPVIHER